LRESELKGEEELGGLEGDGEGDGGGEGAHLEVKMTSGRGYESGRRWDGLTQSNLRQDLGGNQCEVLGNIAERQDADHGRLMEAEI